VYHLPKDLSNTGKMMKITLMDRTLSLPLSSKELKKLKRDLIDTGALNSFDSQLKSEFEEDKALNLLITLDALNSTSKKLKSLSKNDYKAVLLLLSNGLYDSIDDAINHLYKLECTGTHEMKDVAYNFLKKNRALENVDDEVAEHFNYDSYAKIMESKSIYLKDIDGVIWHFDKEKKCFLCKLKKAGILSFKAIVFLMLFGMISYLVLTELFNILL
jgi:hypothetical protein